MITSVFQAFLTQSTSSINICQQIRLLQGLCGKESLSKQETWVRSLGQEDPLKKEMATSSSILAWEVLWTEDPGGLQSMGLQRLDMN